ncbi:hypothetical protein Cyrtocomes_00906 [Candidatus Cyrtobacter comes]|uniref:Uncharacterized protein n=1 Tax=Candidatus Cyrtobacter comes TaxID=675776 RepID=A0ABU5L9K6_9RICK|nr:hypothetical protein [Candidatus Cyrtobacter comes]MDZ5762519.1 hypothetical protein [Candidatus Cyrtobacter comes]
MPNTFLSSLDNLDGIIKANTGVELDALMAEMSENISNMERASALFAKIIAQNSQTSREMSSMLR